jgi:hypothetical protein
MASREKLVYVSGPYRAETINGVFENVYRARKHALYLWNLGYSVLCPHTNTAFMDGSLDDEAWLEGDLVMLARCDLIYMVPGWESSEGAKVELDRARESGIRRLPTNPNV